MTTVAADKRMPAKFNIKNKTSLAVVIGIVLVCILFSAVTTTFASTSNLARLLRQMAVMVVISTGMTFVVATGEMDISVGAIYNLVVNCMALMILHWGINPWLAAVLGILLGIFCGGINGLIGMFLGLPMIIITLGSSYIYKVLPQSSPADIVWEIWGKAAFSILA